MVITSIKTRVLQAKIPYLRMIVTDGNKRLYIIPILYNRIFKIIGGYITDKALFNKNRLIQRAAAHQTGRFYVVAVTDGIYSIENFTGTEAEYNAYMAAHNITDDQILCYTR